MNFENDEQSATKLYFSEWLLEESIILPTIEETDLAVILHTLDLAALKGVKLSQGQVSKCFKYGKTYLWNTETTIFQLGI
jgi:hypothetical protein